MSLILDALRKMEEDRKSRRSAAQDIRPEVLRYRVAIKPQEEKPYLLVVVALVLLAAGTGAGLFLRGSGRTISPATAPAVAPAALPEPLVARPAPAIAVPPSQPVDYASPVQSSGSRRRGRKPAAASAVPTEAAGLQQSQPQHRDATGDLPTLPEISVSGIAWQDERSLRRAVLNGALVGEGAEVAGARVVEIRENRVRVLRGGQLFDIVFSSGQSSR